MKYRVRHSTTYEYAERFSSCHNQVHLIPRELPTQRCLVSELRVDPQPEWSERHTDWHGNVVESFALHTSHALLNITAMLLVFVALVALVNGALGALPDVAGAPLTLERIFGWLFAPLAWLIGVPAREALAAGKLLGEKTVLNEFIAYLDLARMGADQLSPRSALLMTYALAGFANFGSLGIMLGGLDALLPKERRAELATLGMKSIPAGLLSTCITAAIVGAVA